MFDIHRGAIVAWKADPHKPLKVISDAYQWEGTMVVTCKACQKPESMGLYAVSSLVPYEEKGESLHG